MAYNNNATDKVYQFICTKIRHNEWLPGERIWTEQEFANNLGVSRVAVRQAIDKLVVLSVLKKKQGSGTYIQENDPIVLLNVPVQTLTVRDLLEIIYFRATFESSNVEQFIENATDDDRRRLEACCEEMSQHIYESDLFYKMDFEFHRIIAEGTQSGFSIKINNFLSEYFISHQKQLYAMIGPDIAMEYHPMILKYIKANDAQLASLLMRRHMEETAKEIKKFIHENGNITDIKGGS